MKKILSALCMALLVACSGGGGIGGPPPTPTPGPTSTPGGCGSMASPRARTGRVLMLPRGKGFRPLTGQHLSYGGGPLLINQQTYLVFWGLDASDPGAQHLQLTLSKVGGSGWFDTVTQYCDGSGNAITNSATFAGAWSDMSQPVPVHPTQAEIESEAVRGAAHFGGVSISTATIIVATPSGHSEAGFGTQFCGWHDATDGGLSYEYIPYMPDAGSSCGANSVKDQYDGFSIVAGHELAESTTDPQPSSGWTDTANGEEIGDLCAWKDLQEVDLNGTSLPMQPLWSNSIGGCAQ